jgi:hypothetical protein
MSSFSPRYGGLRTRAGECGPRAGWHGWACEGSSRDEPVSRMPQVRGRAGRPLQTLDEFSYIPSCARPFIAGGHRDELDFNGSKGFSVSRPSRPAGRSPHAPPLVPGLPGRPGVEPGAFSCALTSFSLPALPCSVATRFRRGRFTTTFARTGMARTSEKDRERGATHEEPRSTRASKGLGSAGPPTSRVRRHYRQDPGRCPAEREKSRPWEGVAETSRLSPLHRRGRSTGRRRPVRGRCTSAP